MQNRTSLRTQNSVPFYFRILDILVIMAALPLALFIYNEEFDNAYILPITITTTAYLFFADSMGLYRRLRLGQFPERLTLVMVVTALSFLITILVHFILKDAQNFSRITFVIWFLASSFGLISWRIAYRFNRKRLYKHGKNLRKVAIIGLTDSGIKLREEIKKYPELGFEFIGCFDDREDTRLPEKELKCLKGKVSDALRLAQEGELDSIYICLPISAENRIASIIRTLSDSTVNVLFVPNFLLNTIMHGNISHLGKVDTISVFEQPANGSQQFYKRAFDIAFSFSALVMLSIPLLIIAIAIKTTSKGPVLFRQDRYGINGKKVSVHKFRSMTVMENSDKVVQAKKGDMRITKVGGFLRRTSLDELPQFYDVLIGNMSVVGPRPHAVAHNEEYRKLVDYYMLRHQVKPGITGWAQINGWRGETDTLDKMEKRIEYDLDYIRNWSLWFDIKIVYLTIFKGFINKNAY